MSETTSGAAAAHDGATSEAAAAARDGATSEAAERDGATSGAAARDGATSGAAARDGATSETAAHHGVTSGAAARDGATSETAAAGGGTTGASTTPISSVEQAARATRYARAREALFVIGLLWRWGIGLGIYLTGTSAWARNLTARVAGRRRPVSDGLYTVLTALVATGLSLPLAYLRDYIVEHRFGLSNQTRRDWLVDQAKGTAVGLAFEVPIAAVVYATIRRSPDRWWLILSGMALPFTVLLAQLYPTVIAPIFNRFDPLPDRQLADRIRALSQRAGVSIADVTVMDMSRQTRKANAFFAGVGRARRIALGDTLISELTPDELEVIVAHELAHQVRRDVWKGIALGSAATLGSAFILARLAPDLIDRLSARSGVRRLDDVASTPLLELVLGVLSIAMMPLANWYSRTMIERPADRYALELTDRPAAFASAMEKLARTNLSDPNPPWLVRVLLHSHPTAAERIAMAREYAAGRAG